MASFTLAQPNPQTRWLPGRGLTLMTLVLLTVLTCGGILALMIISSSSIKSAPADETASPLQNWTVQATTVIEPTRIIGSVYASPIPKRDVPDDLVFLDKGNSNFDLTTKAWVAWTCSSTMQVSTVTGLSWKCQTRTGRRLFQPS